MRGAILALALVLTGCASAPAGSPTGPPAATQARLDVAKLGLGVDAAFHGAQSAYIRLHANLSPASQARARVIFAQLESCPTVATCQGAIPTIDAAVKAGEASGLQDHIDTAMTLIAEINDLLTNPK